MSLETKHNIITSDSRCMDMIDDCSIDLVVTSPPYPMVQMWDDLFSSYSGNIRDALLKEDGNSAFEEMHNELDKTWNELYRILKSGSFACINIGDATRTIGGKFSLYSNHSRIIQAFVKAGFDSLPLILWKKQTNAPNKFMGSGMLPAGAYVTLEHEYILIFRKGGKKDYNSETEKKARMNSAFFWEERNKWFSDVWEFKGTTQSAGGFSRDRSAAFPFELAYRLINMYSLYGDTVLDPFLGTGTTMLAAIASGRSSKGIDIDRSFSAMAYDNAKSFYRKAAEIAEKRFSDHADFIESYETLKGGIKHKNIIHGFKVITQQETEIELYKVKDITGKGSTLNASYESVCKNKKLKV